MARNYITPQEVNAIGLEFVQPRFPDFEVVAATHVDTGHLHNHMVVNSQRGDGRLGQEDARLGDSNSIINQESICQGGISPKR